MWNYDLTYTLRSEKPSPPYKPVPCDDLHVDGPFLSTKLITITVSPHVLSRTGASLRTHVFVRLLQCVCVCVCVKQVNVGFAKKKQLSWEIITIRLNDNVTVETLFSGISPSIAGAALSDPITFDVSFQSDGVRSEIVCVRVCVCSEWSDGDHFHYKCSMIGDK